MACLAAMGALTAISFVLATTQERYNSVQKFVLAGKHAHALAGPVKLICNPSVVEADWSPDGNFVIVHQMEDNPTREQMKQAFMDSESNLEEGPVSIKIWNRKSGRLAEVMRIDPSITEIVSFEWVGGTSTILASITESSGLDNERGRRDGLSQVIEIDALTGSKRTLISSRVGDGIHVTSVGKLPLALMLNAAGAAEEAYQLTVYRPGKALLAQSVPRGHSPMAVTPDGVTLLMAGITRDAQRIRAVSYLAMNLSTGVVSQASPNAMTDENLIHLWERFQVGSEGELSLEPELGTFIQEQLTPVYIVSADRDPKPKGRKRVTPSLLVSGEAQMAALSPNGNAVIYVTRGMLFLRNIVALDMAEFEKAERADAMNRAKQVALAMLMYASDYDDIAVPNQSDWKDLVEPYIRRSDFFDSFEYTFAGGAITDVRDPSAAQLGYIPVTGGRVVAFLDGHVEFRASGLEEQPVSDRPRRTTAGPAPPGCRNLVPCGPPGEF